MNFKVSLISPQIVHFKFSDQYSLASTFIRIQEFYESPFENIRGKKFVLEEYMDTEAKINGIFDYFTKWEGFNFSSTIINKWWKIHNNQLRDKENKLIDYIDWLVDSKKKYYVIGTYQDKNINHELAHAFYYLSKNYRKTILDLIKHIPKKIIKEEYNRLISWGYDKSIIPDEIQAYLSTEIYWYNVSIKDLKKFKEVFQSEKLKFSIETHFC